MSKVVTVVFDGQVLRPNAPLDLEPGKRYVITIEAEPAIATGDAWDALEALAGTVEAPSDWSIEHDHYLYGTPKRQPKVDHES
jgi:predicted DNA-binding antitoxin AbrB/MazE fold protein